MTELVIPQSISTRDKLVFWLFLSGLSAVSAEVISSATLFPFFTFWGWVAVIPLYGLHVLLLAWLSFRGRRVTVTTLFLAGAILGMYEAYLTKVLWSPTWGDWNYQFAGIYVIQTVVLVLFWHPLMAYILPVFLAENLLTQSSETLEALPKRLRDALTTKSGWTKFVILLVIYVSLCKSFSAEGWLINFISSLSNIAVLIGLGWWWQRVRAGRNLTFRDLLPSKKEAIILTFVFLFLFILLGAITRPESMPRTLVPHLTVWVIYAVLFMLLYFNVKRAPGFKEPPQPAPFSREALRTGILFLILSPILSTLLIPVKIISIILVLLSWVIGCVLGAIILLRSIRALLPEKRDAK